MTSHPFAALRGEYERMIARARIRPECQHALTATARRLLANKGVYATLSARTTVPAVVLMALAEREMSGNLHCYLGNGEPLNRVTRLVPKGRGPFLQPFPDNFIAGACDALHLDGLDQVAAGIGWSMASAAYESEEWNGWGYRSRGIPSPYVFGGTTVQKRGKFVRDGLYDASVMDPQLGTVAIIETLIALDASLAFADAIANVDDAPPLAPEPHPVMGDIDIGWVQEKLNLLEVPGTPLKVDGNCGRATRAVVRQFEIDHGLTVDRGYPGREVVGCIMGLLVQRGIPA
jgi:lysozyme family protein